MTDTAARLVGAGLIVLCLATSLMLHSSLDPAQRSPTLTQSVLTMTTLLAFLLGIAALVHGRTLFRG